MKKWFYKAYGPYVGCEQTGVFEADTQQEAEDIAYEIAIENYHSYSFQEEEDIEPEYDFYVEPYDPEAHDHKI
jgi:hypothetical protein